MALDHGYGVAIGTVASFTRDDPDEFGHWYHGHLRVTTPAGDYESALDVDTPSGVGVSFRIVDGLTIADFPALAPLGDGFHPLASTSTSGALDYVRSPQLQDFRWVRVVARWLPLWRLVVPVRLHAWLLPLRRWLVWFRWFPWISSNGDNALDRLEAILPSATRVCLFGEPYSSGLGIHNVHLNQGDPPGPHQAENAIWQDGAVLVRHADDSVTVWQVRFNSQSLHTDAAGHPL
ncbi:MAG: DUF2278 family protein [Nocardioidaceae bacterium]